MLPCYHMVTERMQGACPKMATFIICYHVTMLPCYPSVYKTRHTPVSQIPPLMSTNKRAETGLVSGKLFTQFIKRPSESSLVKTSNLETLPRKLSIL